MLKKSDTNKNKNNPKKYNYQSKNTLTAQKRKSTPQYLTKSKTKNKTQIKTKYKNPTKRKSPQKIISPGKKLHHKI